MPLGRAVEQGLVKEGGKLGQVLGGIERGFGSNPKNALEALGLVKSATGAVGLEPGVATLGKLAKLCSTMWWSCDTLGADGSILVQRSSDVLLHFG